MARWSKVQAYLLPPLSSGGASIAIPSLPFPHPPHRTGLADFPHPALGQNITLSPTARRALFKIDERDLTSRRDTGLDEPHIYSV